MKNLLAMALLCAFTCCSFAQENNALIIEYNLYDDYVVYKRNNEVIEKPFVRRGDNINVIVTEFNPYTTKATIEVDQIGYLQSSQVSGLTPQNYEGGSSGGMLLGGDLNLGEGIFSLLSSIPGSRGGASKEALVAQSKYTALTQRTKETEIRINTFREKAELIINSERSKQLALADIYNLKQNTIIRPSRIKNLMEEEVLHAFAKTKNEPIGIDDLVSEMHKTAEVNKTVKGYNEAIEEYIDLAREWQSFSGTLENLQYDSSDDKMKHIVNSSSSMKRKMHDNLNNSPELKTTDLIQADSTANIGDMAALRMIYEELISDKSFQHSFTPIQAQGDEVTIKILFSQKDSKGNFDQTRSLTQTIPVAGHWKVSGSVGISFGKFAEKVSNYSVAEERITETPADDFIPQIASFVHMIRQTPKNVDLGLSLGVGIPLLNGGESSSASFFLGPTILVGQNQRLMFSGGIMGAKATRLSGGYNAGDSFTSAAEFLPLTSTYELGYFIGISFSVL